MPLFKQNQDRPDNPKDAPKKKGILRLLLILWREFFPLLKLNLLFILCCIPVVTIPAAITAMSRITGSMARDENYFLWADYKKAFKRDFGKALLGGVIFLLLLGVFGLSTWFYFMLYGNSKLFIILAGFALCLVMTTLCAAFYFFPSLAFVELPIKAMLINSVVMVFTCFKRTLLAFLGFFIFMGIGIALYPSSSFFILLLMFSLSSLMVCMGVMPAIEEKVMVFTPEQAAALRARRGEPEPVKEEELSSAQQFTWDEKEEESK